jgi:hypothetical protein
MKTINLDTYGPVISDKEIGQKIYLLIKEEAAKGDQVEIDLKSIKSMATYCAKQIFGNLYIELTPSVFFNNILLKNANNDVRSIIKIGIQHALSTQKGSV